MTTHHTPHDPGFFRQFMDRFGRPVLVNIVALCLLAVDDRVPLHLRASIIATLAYVALPADLIPDVTPFAGFTDDVAAIGAALTLVSAFLDDDLRQRAHDIVDGWFD